MRLQVKKIGGPNEIRIDQVLPAPPQNEQGKDIIDTSNPTSTTVANSTTDHVFYCEFNRTTRDTDCTVSGDEGTEEEAAATLTLTLRFYNNRGTTIGEDVTLQASAENITPAAGTTPERLYFTITPGSELTGSSFYVHAIIPNEAAGANNISLSSSSYHETMKHVHVYSERNIHLLYWSNLDQTHQMEQEEGTQTEASLADERYIHIKTAGLYSEIVRLRITEGEPGEGRQVLREIRVPLQRNQRAVKIDLRDMVSRYCSLHNLSGDEAEDINLVLTASATYEETETRTQVTGPISTLTLNVTTQEIEVQEAQAGTVPFVVDDGTVYGVAPTRYTDFLIGHLCHVEGVGRVAARENDDPITDNNPARFTIYPFHIYEIMLSDLVGCGLITLEEASYLTTTNHDLRNLRGRGNLESTFNKITAPLSSGKTLISIFRDANNDNRIKGTNVRKLLTQIQHKGTSFNGQNVICRDAWQKRSRSNNVMTKIHIRPDIHRYSRNKECPFGEYFLNYRTGGFYRVYASRYTLEGNTGQNLCMIDTYRENRTINRTESPNPINRTEIALHTGSPRFSTGCLTFNVPYDNPNQGNYLTLNEYLYSENNNNRKMNLICIDERNAIPITNDTDTYIGRRVSVTDTGTDTTLVVNNQDSFDFQRFYDLVEPHNDLNINL